MSLSKREMREDAFKLIFEMQLNDSTLEEIIENAKEADDKEFCDYAILCATGVSNHKDEIDEIITKYLKPGWKITRISNASANILRLALYEILYVDEVPTPVAINEAVELCKKYTIPDDSSFVNGLLGAYVKDNG